MKEDIEKLKENVAMAHEDLEAVKSELAAEDSDD